MLRKKYNMFLPGFRSFVPRLLMRLAIEAFVVNWCLTVDLKPLASDGSLAAKWEHVTGKNDLNSSHKSKLFLNTIGNATARSSWKMLLLLISWINMSKYWYLSKRKASILSDGRYCKRITKKNVYKPPWLGREFDFCPSQEVATLL